ncbi:MAG: hypothetical protein JO270_04850 [Acidobacteriaceae bacterium]|nr:hypothetical protein [Acidobacteriaceae bacterium]MBV8569722.1 hypothetical protein [Acidobacteriaceae bacterium]
MKSKDRRNGSITEPLLKDMLDRQQADCETQMQEVTVGSKPLAPPALYEDPGQGYNPDFTFPQE